MAKRTTPQLGMGDYVTQDPEDSQSVFFARIALIEATRRHLPQFLQRLSREVFPEFCRLVEGNGSLRGIPITWQMAQSLSSGIEHERFNQVLIGWARAFNAEEEWILQQAWRALQVWLAFPEFRESLEWGQGHAWREVFRSERFQFEWESWQVQLRPWTKYRAGLQRAFEKAVKEFEITTRAAALAHGLISAPRTHSADNFDWFILYQFRGLSSSKIAARIAASGKSGAPPDPSTILKGVRAAQKLVGWKCLRANSQRRKTR